VDYISLLYPIIDKPNRIIFVITEGNILRVKCNYSVSLGLIGVITSLTNMKKQEVWSHLADATQVCFDRIAKKPNMYKSWRWWTFPGTPLRLKIIVNKGYSNSKGRQDPHRCEIKLDSNQIERFTSEQVEEFLVEKVLLGVECGT